MKRLPYLICGCVLATALTACATKDSKQATAKKKDVYVWYTPTGSNIPILVKKTDFDAAVPSNEATQNALRQAQDKGGTEHRHD